MYYVMLIRSTYLYQCVFECRQNGFYLYIPGNMVWITEINQRVATPVYRPVEMLKHYLLHICRLITGGSKGGHMGS